MSLAIAGDSQSGVEPIDEAGDEQTFDFHPLFLPIGTDTLGNSLCADLRNGEHHGCIGAWDHESGWDDALFWDNIIDMLTDVRNALINGSPTLVSYAYRRGQRFAGYTVDTPIFYAAVTGDSELAWRAAELGQ